MMRGATKEILRLENAHVSVCLVTYNGAATVERALKSLLAQTYQDYEIIISDDHSTDETLSICRRIAAGHDRVRFVYPERNLGAMANMRFALSHARDKYFVWACQDDYWEPEFLERLVEVLEESPTAICAQGWVRWVANDGSGVQDIRLYGRDLPERHSRLSLAASILTGRSREGNLQGKKRNILKNSVYLHGVWNRSAFTAAVIAHQKLFTNERQILCQAALAGEFRYVDQLLFYKTFYSLKLKEREGADSPTVIAKKHTGWWQEFFDTLAAIRRSQIVAPHMKLLAPPVLFFSFSRLARKRRWGIFRFLPVR